MESSGSASADDKDKDQQYESVPKKAKITKDDAPPTTDKEGEGETGKPSPPAMIGTIKDEFRDVPDNPIWLTIATFLNTDERERIFPNIPELKGIERLADAVIATSNTLEYIKNLSKDERYTFFIEKCNMPKLFPEGFGQFIKKLNDRSKAVPPAPPKLNVLKDSDHPEIVIKKISSNQILSEMHSMEMRHFNIETASDKNYKCYAPERMAKIMMGKDKTLYEQIDPISRLDAPTDGNAEKNGKDEMWVNWGFKGGFGDSNRFEQFCALAGIEDPYNSGVFEIYPPLGTMGANRGTTWISKDRKVLIKQWSIYFGCTAERSRGKFLFEWLRDNCGDCDEYNEYNEYCWKYRRYI